MGTVTAAAFAHELAQQFPMAPALIVRASAAANARAINQDELTYDDIRAGVRAVLDDSLSTYAKRQRVTQTLQDVVLEPDHLDAIAALIARIRGRSTVQEDWQFGDKVGNKGLGVAALFCGPPGTGKSMCASVIANELGIDIYAVNMSKITSKWIGESEKSLSALFDAAEAGHAILLFNEADALFGKRTTQKSSNDRFANQETNFLLDKLESYSGICFLTSNNDSNIDQAFVRRLTLRLSFALPDEGERERLWRTMIPSTAPSDPHIDFGALARRYVMSGGHIRNAVLSAAFLAADAGTPLTSHLLNAGGRGEYISMGSVSTPM